MRNNGNPHETSLTAADLFAGAGGLSVGFHKAGFESLFFNEMDERAGATFSRNFPGAAPFVCPVEELSAGRIRDESALGDGDLDVMVGGPPCQGFSINAPARRGSDERNHLFRHFIRIVLEGIRPKFVVIENVPGLASLGGGETLGSVLAAFEGAGYRVAFRILNAAHYGTPQERWRLFFIGTRLRGVELSFPEPTHFSLQRPNFTGGREHIFRHAVGGGSQAGLFGEPLMAPTTVGEAIGDLPPIPSGGGAAGMEYEREAGSAYQSEIRAGSRKIHNHECAGVSGVNLERMRHVGPGGSWRDIPFELLPKGMQRARRSDHTRRYGRLHPDRLSPTVMTKCDPHWGTVFHYEQERIISVREAARIQSFPDWFRFTGSKADQYRQVGNAVPPMLAQAVAGHVRGMLERAEGRRAERGDQRITHFTG
ncbi:MAG: DNA cytosine methyltransferase [Actinomycetota bacterium]|jgi:DNA (cytosine-5)-methyltransferase 1|nr:DNA cytosine methyltransferase [Actinomycetota bacterium]